MAFAPINPRPDSPVTCCQTLRFHLTQDAVKRSRCDLHRRNGNLPGDAGRPCLDIVPVPKVPLGKEIAPARQLAEEPVREPEFRRVEGAGEDPGIPGMDEPAEFGDLVGLDPRGVRRDSLRLGL
jgi:hypothetical protein